MSDEPVNRAIDEAARRMTDGAPADGFRRRVLARIEAGEAPRRSWRAAFVLSPIAAAAMVIALFVARDTIRFPPAATEVPTVATSTPPAAPAAAPDVPAVAAPAQTRLAEARGASRRAEADARSASSRAEAEPPLDAIGVPSIAVAPLAVDTMTPDSIQIRRLDTITPITVAPLDMTDVQRRYE